MKHALLLLALTASSCMGAGPDLVVGTNRYEIVFEDAALPVVNRTRFASDITEAFSFESDPSNVFQMAETEDAYFGELKDGRYSSLYSFTEIWEGISLTNDAGTVKCYAAKLLTDDHAGRLARFASFATELQELDDLIGILNDGSFTNLSLQAKMDCFWPAVTVPANPTPEQLAEADDKLFSVLRTYVVSTPSIFRLESSRTSGGVTAALCGYCPFVPKEGNSDPCMYIPIGYVDGKWRFFFGM